MFQILMLVLVASLVCGVCLMLVMWLFPVRRSTVNATWRAAHPTGYASVKDARSDRYAIITTVAILAITGAALYLFS